MGQNSLTRCALAMFLGVFAVLLTGCDRRTIRQISAEPGRYALHEVVIEGEVTQSYSVLGRGAYLVDDGTGKLWVLAQHGVPRQGARVGVKGRIRDGFDLGTLVKLPDQVGNGLVMLETEHRAR